MLTQNGLALFQFCVVDMECFPIRTSDIAIKNCGNCFTMESLLSGKVIVAVLNNWSKVSG